MRRRKFAKFNLLIYDTQISGLSLKFQHIHNAPIFYTRRGEFSSNRILRQCTILCSWDGQLQSLMLMSCWIRFFCQSILKWFLIEALEFGNTFESYWRLAGNFTFIFCCSWERNEFILPNISPWKSGKMLVFCYASFHLERNDLDVQNWDEGVPLTHP
jgi:hypothetical protein